MPKTDSQDWLAPDPQEQGTPGVRKWSRSEAEDTVPMSNPDGPASGRISVPVAGPTPAQSSAYVSARPPPQVSAHRTFEMDSVKVTEEDPRRAHTVPRMRAPSVDRETPAPYQLETTPLSSGARDDVEPAVLSERRSISPAARSRGGAVLLWGSAVAIVLLGGVLFLGYRAQVSAPSAESPLSASKKDANSTVGSAPGVLASQPAELAPVCAGADPACGAGTASISGNPAGNSASGPGAAGQPKARPSHEPVSTREPASESANASDEKKLWLE
jgi:hypothetical protein